VTYPGQTIVLILKLKNGSSCSRRSREAAASKELTVSDELQLEFQSGPTTSLISTLDLIANQFLRPPILISLPRLNFSPSFFLSFLLIFVFVIMKQRRQLTNLALSRVSYGETSIKFIMSYANVFLS